LPEKSIIPPVEAIPGPGKRTGFNGGLFQGSDMMLNRRIECWKILNFNSWLPTRARPRMVDSV
jgi:hypothetical protein